MSLSDDQIHRLARLARIAVGPEESGPVRERLNRVLELIDQLRAVDTSGVEPMAHPLDARLPGGQRLRPDEVIDETAVPDRRALYQSDSVAPAVQDGLYLVPKVIE
jgi:aspartyl-tRNA(Asn)/glutamyl-tRNA(Gln) amidotransferase subunit C